MSDYDARRREHARLTILKSLAAQVDERLNSALIQADLERFEGIAVDRLWVHAELDWLASMEAVWLLKPEGASVVIATLTEKGARHLKRAVAIPGIARPDRPG